MYWLHNTVSHLHPQMQMLPPQTEEQKETVKGSGTEYKALLGHVISMNYSIINNNNNNGQESLATTILFYSAAAGAVMAAFLFAVSLCHVFGVTYPEMLAEYSDPDYEIYRNNPAHWIEEIHHYMESLNETIMTPVCCKQFPE